MVETFFDRPLEPRLFCCLTHTTEAPGLLLSCSVSLVPSLSLFDLRRACGSERDTHLIPITIHHLLDLPITHNRSLRNRSAAHYIPARADSVFVASPTIPSFIAQVLLARLQSGQLFSAFLRSTLPVETLLLPIQQFETGYSELLSSRIPRLNQQTQSQ